MKEIFLKKGFTNEQAEILKEAFLNTRQYEEGDNFQQEGQVCQHIALIVKGQFRYFYHTEEGEVTRWISLEGDFMTSLSSFIQQKPAVENIQATKDCTLALLSKTSWTKLYAEYEFIREFWLRTISYNYIGMEERVFHQIALSAEQRYQWMLENYPRFNQEVPDKYIASMLGITPRHLSRIRAKRI
ncbi:Crp/Fnr family transcriptional regulator [Lunatimonas lonarensis]|uniref:Crp/Fnr family transcriptional regulator n=1 Tax=Lunatimonas lonarensis TaxID=1232681 RepID=UPI00138B0348|nr:Crp/Fnr family transcriptional regulator [Lunatimonas lonarensis]